MAHAKYWCPNVTERLLAAFMVCLAAGSASGEQGAAERIAGLLMPVERFEAEFTQTVLGERGELRENSAGYVRIARPRQFKWVVEDPYPQLIVTDGDTLYVYEPDLDQVQVRAIADALDGTPALVLTGDAARIADHFDVSEQTMNGLRTFTLVPRSTKALYTEMHMMFDEGQLAAIDIRDSLGQSTEVRFYNTDTAPNFPDNEFEFTIPPNAEVIGEAAGDVGAIDGASIGDAPPDPA